MGVLRIHHVLICIPVGVEDEARAFYCGVLGLNEIEKPESLKGRGGFWLQVGDRSVHVGTEEVVDRRKTKAHIAYEVDDVEEMKEKLIRHNMDILESVPIEGFDRFEIRDPFGNRLEFIKPID